MAISEAEAGSAVVDFTDSPIRFGAADADLQVIGETRTIECEGAQPTMWSRFAERSDGLSSMGTPASGINRYDRWQEDADLMASLGIRHYRTSVSWSRVLTPDGEPNEKALAWYRRYFEALRDRGISVYATLYHWEMPEAVAAAGGWASRKTIDLFLRHCTVVKSHLDPLIEEYFVLNEPSCAALFGYHRGLHAPGERSLAAALRASHHLLLAQGLATRELRKGGTKVSTVVNSQPAYAATASSADMHARDLSDAYWNGWFMEPLYRGGYPEVLSDYYGSRMPECGPGDLDVMRVGHMLHALGVNYYNGEVVRHTSDSEMGYERCVVPDAPTNDLGWPVFVPPYYPQGLYDGLRDMYLRYREHGLSRIYVTETGLASRGRGDDPCDDESRIGFLKSHLSQAHAALRSGVPLEAFFVWSLCDSYEWQDGYRPESRFGLVYVDRTTFERRPKKSAQWYATFMRERQFPVAKE